MPKGLVKLGWIWVANEEVGDDEVSSGCNADDQVIEKKQFLEEVKDTIEVRQ